MTPEKIRKAIEIYRFQFEEAGVNKIDYPHEEIVHSLSNVLGHCYGMLDRVLGFIEEGRTEKAFRWLGFIQGCLWASKIYPLSDIKDHNHS